jgi:predicted RNA-binding Zn ribbon-like protein
MKSAMNRRAKTSSVIVAPRRDLCLDFANTLMYGGGKSQETLHDFAELVRWCDANGALGRDAAERAVLWSHKDALDTAAIFDEAIALREAIYRICFAIAAGKTPEARDVAAMNAALDRAPERRTLAYRDQSFGWRIDRDSFSAADLLAPVLWSAGDLIVSPEVGRLRHCLNDQCGWLFMDDSKNGSRRWCSMQACGNRAKAYRHYLRSKQK